MLHQLLTNIIYLQNVTYLLLTVRCVAYSYYIIQNYTNYINKTLQKKINKNLDACVQGDRIQFRLRIPLNITMSTSTPTPVLECTYACQKYEPCKLESKLNITFFSFI